jgi:hypothetical protein
MHGSQPNRGVFRLAIFAVSALLTRLTLGVEPPAAVVVLRNGNVLEGAVQKTGESYRIEAPGWSIQVPADQVDIACGSLKEAYEIQRRRYSGSSADGHLELARWCLRQGLLDQTAREILDARTADPANRALPSLELQLRQASDVHAIKQTMVKRDSSVVPASAVAEKVTHSVSSPAEVPLDAQMQFVRSIQPMLVHNCAFGGCHHPGAPHKMQLDRWAVVGAGNRTLIRRNLDAVLAELNKEDPSKSRLLERARQAHGLPNQPSSRPLTPLQTNLLLTWLNQAAGKTALPEAAPPDMDGHEAAAPAESSDEGMIDDTDGADNPASKAALPFKPRDAFDPEIFNRRHATRAFTGLPSK